MNNVAQQQATKEAAIRIDRALTALSCAQVELSHVTRYCNRGCVSTEHLAQVNVSLRAILRHSVKLQELLNEIDPIGGAA